MNLALNCERCTLPKGFEKVFSCIGDACIVLEGLHGVYQVSLLLTDDEGIATLNKSFRAINSPTDVLSFPAITFKSGTAHDHPKNLRKCMDVETGCIHVGDISISIPRAMEQATVYQHSYLREIGFLFAHGMLHLLGYDHQTEEDRKKMRSMEEAVMQKTGLVRELSSDDQKMVTLAFEALKSAYVPYSSYQVGACVRDEQGQLYTGCNVENASYGLTICAERNAITTAVTDGMRRMSAIAIVIEHGMPSPCGACRQFMREFASDMKVILASHDGARITTLSALLPDSFGPESLEETQV